MKPVSRHHVHKGKSAGQFRRNVKTVAAANLKMGLQRGGWRL